MKKKHYFINTTQFVRQTVWKCWGIQCILYLYAANKMLNVLEKVILADF